MTSVEKTVDTLVQSFQAFQDNHDKAIKSLSNRLTEQGNGRQVQTSLDIPFHSLPYKSLKGDNTMMDTTISLDEPEYKSAFTTYLKTGQENAVRAYETKTMSTLSGEEGGYMVPQALVAKLEQDVSDISVVRRLANVMSISSSSVDLLLNVNGAAAGWTAENGNRDETDAANVRKVNIVAHELYAKPRATQKLLDDAAVNVDQWLSEAISNRLAAMENHSFLHGDGNNKPKGILTYETAEDAEWGKFKGISYDENNLLDNLVDMFASIKGDYLNGSSWLMSRKTLGQLRKLKDQDGRHIWQPSLDAKTPSLLLGYPVEICDDMPTLATENTPSILFGNFTKAYQIVDRQGVSVLRDPYSAKPYVEFYTTKRVGGDVVNFEALTALVNVSAE